MHVPDPRLHYVIGFSGGKDSVATWLYLTRELKLPRVTCLFADVGHEFPEVNEYLDLLEREHGLPLVRIHATLAEFIGELATDKMLERLGLVSDELSRWPRSMWQYGVPGWMNRRLDMESLAILKRRFPSPTARFCTYILKLLPSARWARGHCDLAETIRVSGVRAEESPARAAHPEFQHDEIMGCGMWLPIHKWTHQDVFAMHAKHGVPVNPLYLMGMGRVGCAPCIMANKSELSAIAMRKPEAFDRLWDMERRVAESVGVSHQSWFSPSKVPAAFCSHRCHNTGKPFPDAYDVKRWALGEPPPDQPSLFADDHTEDALACSSIYGLCE